MWENLVWYQFTTGKPLRHACVPGSLEQSWGEAFLDAEFSPLPLSSDKLSEHRRVPQCLLTLPGEEEMNG